MPKLSMVKPEVHEPASEYVDVTPAMAEKWLEANPNNRSIDDRKVEQYARDMVAGKWRLTNQGIGFGRDGNLYDGQHRLWAVYKAGVAVRMLVVTGLEPDARPAIDVGKPRRVHDQLRMFGGVDRARDISAWANATARLVYDVSTSLSYDDVSAWLEANAADIAWGLNVMPKSSRRVFGSAPVMAALVFAHRKAPARLDEFAARVIGGENLARGEAAHTLREYLIASAQGAALDKTEARWISAKVLRAAQAHVQGLGIGKLQRGEEGLRFFVDAHTPATLPPAPVTKREAADEAAAALFERVRGLRSLARIVHLLCDSGMSPTDVTPWLLHFQSRIPLLASYVPSDLALRIAAILDARR